MGSISKGFSLLLVLLLAVSILMVIKPAFAQTPTPSIPSVSTFAVTLTNASYYSPPTYYTDPQTGANITVAGSFVNLENLTFTIQNQHSVTFYVIRWTTPYMTGWNNIHGYYDGDVMNATLESSSGSTTTWVLTGTYGQFLVYGKNDQSTMVEGYSFEFDDFSLNFESGATIEFQVQAVYGSAQYADPYPYFDEEQYYIIGGASDWSSTQTIVIPATSASVSPSPTPAPSSSTPTPASTPVNSASYASLLLITTIALVVIAFLLVVIISLLHYMKKRRIA